jgi:hypothetical protein
MKLSKILKSALAGNDYSCQRQSSSDFTASFFGFPKEMFREACLRFEPIFFRFIKEKPCYVLPEENTGAINGLYTCTRPLYTTTAKIVSATKLLKITSSRYVGHL